MSRFLTLGGYFSIQDFLSGWFHGAPFDQIYRENCVAFVAYAFYNRDYDDLPARVGLAAVLSASTSFTRSLTHSLAHALCAPPKKPAQESVWNTAVLCFRVTVSHFCFLPCEASHHLHSGGNHCIFNPMNSVNSNFQTQPSCSKSVWSICSILLLSC